MSALGGALLVGTLALLVGAPAWFIVLVALLGAAADGSGSLANRWPRWLRSSLGVAAVGGLLAFAFGRSTLAGSGLSIIFGLVALRYLFYPVCNYCGGTGCSHPSAEIQGRIPPGSTGRMYVGKTIEVDGVVYAPGYYGQKATSRFERFWARRREAVAAG